MKNNIFYALFLISVLVSCKKPEACLTASSTNVKVGEDITFTDCSTDSKKSKIDFGDNQSLSKTFEGSITYAYTNPGTFDAKIEVYNKRDNKKDESVTKITVAAPTEAELTTGQWRKNKEEDYFAGSSSYNLTNSVWTFNSNGTFDVDGNGYTNTWELSGNSLVTDNYGSFRITKLYNGVMILRYDEIDFFGGLSYSAYHFVNE
jgi:hypothetical protein